MNKPTIDDLEMLNPWELNKLLLNEIWTRSPDVQFIRDLIFSGCPTEGMNPDSWTPLQWAAQSGKLEAVECLISNGAYVDTAETKNGMTALHWAARNGHLEVVKSLISAGAQLDVRDKYETTALHHAAQWGHLDIVKLLLFLGADVRARDNIGSTAWDLAHSHVREIVPELEPK